MDRGETPQKIKQNIRHQSELYDQYPEIRRVLLSAWYGRTGRRLLEERPRSAKAILYFLKSTYYSEENKGEKGIEAVASLFDRPGHTIAFRVRDAIFGEKA